MHIQEKKKEKRKKKKENPSSTCEYPCEQAKPGHKDGHISRCDRAECDGE
jgi:hypothetical protein